MEIELSPKYCGKSIQNEKFDVRIPDLKPQTVINNTNHNSNLFNCGDSNDLSKTEKGLLDEFRKFLQQ